MHVEQEPQGSAGDALGVPDGPDAHRLAARRDVPGRDLDAVDEQGADLGERNAEGLDEVAEGGDPVGGRADGAAGAGARDEQVQFGGELDVDIGTVHLVRMPRGSRPGPALFRACGRLVGDQRDAHVVRDEGGQREGVEDLVEAEPAR